jgi:ATP-binding cassette subfamily C (CFTR/MRP) protein 10
MKNNVGFIYISNNTDFLCGFSGTVIITIYGLPWLVLVLAPLVPVYHWLQELYRLTSRELKRLASVTLSPVYSHFNETLLGLPTIRSFRAVPRSVFPTKISC